MILLTFIFFLTNAGTGMPNKPINAKKNEKLHFQPKKIAKAKQTKKVTWFYNNGEGNMEVMGILFVIFALAVIFFIPTISFAIIWAFFKLSTWWGIVGGILSLGIIIT